MYTAMKYWGKKPHNIWRAYIETYTQPGEIVLDPFAGSAVAAFEAVKCGRRAIAFDLNPLTAFLIRVYAAPFDQDAFSAAVAALIKQVQDDPVYQTYFTTTCRHCGHTVPIQHFKWEDGRIYEYGVCCPACKSRDLLAPDARQQANGKSMQQLSMPGWVPDDLFYPSPSFGRSFLRSIGGNTFRSLWTSRVLYVLAKLFDGILQQPDETLRLQLLFGFIQSVHLCSKMCVPRREKSNRGFSTSWGRAAYLCSKRQMEMNPLLLFQNNCLGKQSVQSALQSVVQYLGRVPRVCDVADVPRGTFPDGCDILYGTVDIEKLSGYVPAGSVPFVITDPPYGGLVQYLDLSNIWLVWLKAYDSRYTPDLEAELTVKPGMQSTEDYTRKFTAGIESLHRALTPDGRAVFTFHNQDLTIWNALLRALSGAGFRVEKVIYQQNRRTGESNVSNPYGTSANDFYLRCVKSDHTARRRASRKEVEDFLVERTEEILRARGEPTPYLTIWSGLLAELSAAGFTLDGFDGSIRRVLERQAGKRFCITETGKSSGALWWLVHPPAPGCGALPLRQRVEQAVIALVKQPGGASMDSIVEALFAQFPGVLTPDIRQIDACVKQHAVLSGGKWIYQGK